MAGEDRKQFLLRIDPRLWVELESWAAQELRSVNGQIEYLLRDAVQRRRGATTTSGGVPITIDPTLGTKKNPSTR